MSPTDRATLLKKLEYLRRTLEELAPYRNLPQEKFLGSLTHRRIVERLLQLAIESVIDCSRLIVVLEDWRGIRDEREAWLVMGERGVLPEGLAERLREAKGFRNILVHEYIDLNPQLVYENLQQGYGNLGEFARAMAAYLTKGDGASTGSA